jgi:multidrug resistance efflux pump
VKRQIPATENELILQRQIDAIESKCKQNALALGEMVLAIQEQLIAANSRNAVNVAALYAALVSKGIVTEREYEDFRATFTASADQATAGVSIQLEDAKKTIAEFAALAKASPEYIGEGE